MVRAVILFEQAPDPARYGQHNDEFSSKVEYTAFRHGRTIGYPSASLASSTTQSSNGTTGRRSRAAANSPEFAAAGEDAMAMGIPFTVHFVEVE